LDPPSEICNPKSAREGRIMPVKRIQSAILVVVAAAGLAGCGTLSSTSFRSDVNSPTGEVAAAADATGGLSAWRQCRHLEISGVVIAYQDGGGRYLMEHTFRVSPSSHALSISAREPRSDYVWQLVGHRFERVQGDPRLDASPLRQDYADYAEAVLEILTAPVRLMEWGGSLTADSATVMIGGRPYHTMEAGSSSGIQRVYYQDEGNSRVDLIWLGDNVSKHFVMVRGYDYAPVSDAGVQIPTKIEVCRSGPERQIGRRIAQVDISL
jgi:hypothetical protein